jgi:hypothetical protein
MQDHRQFRRAARAESPWLNIIAGQQILSSAPARSISHSDFGSKAGFRRRKPLCNSLRPLTGDIHISPSALEPITSNGSRQLLPDQSVVAV